MEHENYIDYYYTVKIGPVSRGEFNVFVLFVNFHKLLVVILVMYLIVTSTNLTTMIQLTFGPVITFSAILELLALGPTWHMPYRN